MNEELQKALGELLNKANDGIDAASGFLVAELPDVIQQLLMWNAYHSIVWGVLYFVCFVLCAWVSVKCIEYTTKDLEIIVFPIGASMLFVLSAIDEFYTSLQIWIAPKVWLLEYAASLTK